MSCGDQSSGQPLPAVDQTSYMPSSSRCTPGQTRLTLQSSSPDSYRLAWLPGM